MFSRIFEALPHLMENGTLLFHRNAAHFWEVNYKEYCFLIDQQMKNILEIYGIFFKRTYFTQVRNSIFSVHKIPNLICLGEN